MSAKTNVVPLELRRELIKIDKQRDTAKLNLERKKQGLKPLVSIEDIRDDTISYIKNSGFSYEEIHNRNGPTPLTLARWRDKEVLSPRMDKIRAALRAVGKDIGIIDYG